MSTQPGAQRSRTASAEATEAAVAAGSGGCADAGELPSALLLMDFQRRPVELVPDGEQAMTAADRARAAAR